MMCSHHYKSDASLIEVATQDLPSTPYIGSLEQLQTSMAESELSEGPFHIDAEFAEVENVRGDDCPEKSNE